VKTPAQKTAHRRLVDDLCENDEEFFRRLFSSDERDLEEERQQLRPLFDAAAWDDSGIQGRRYDLIRKVLEARRLDRLSKIEVPPEFAKDAQEYRDHVYRLGPRLGHDFYEAKKDQRRVDVNGLYKLEKGDAPELWDVRDVRQRLFPGSRPDRFPDRNWASNSPPPEIVCHIDYAFYGVKNAPESIDTVVRKMLAGDKGYQDLRKPEERRRSGIECVYFEARFGILRAVELAVVRATDMKHHAGRGEAATTKEEFLQIIDKTVEHVEMKKRLLDTRSFC
jgi:hypothetical protein